MKCNAAAEQSLLIEQAKVSPVKVSGGAWFYVRSRVTKDVHEYDAFVVPTYSSVQALLASLNSTETALYLGSPKDNGEMMLRRVVAVRDVPGTNLRILVLEGDQAVLWEEAKDADAASVFVDIDEPMSIGKSSQRCD